ncbi:uncharacterized protein LOC104908412 [Beta vulgaris subsp. vulgaris]|uniref:uncharacterized protein LOC104908412 n=1 Tax=Beta vulgaris subsp. vulgaris TaxID=3555 RepID=UPI00203677A6|nr:uncharacterized protein LOC104908412 [Beta vulgaris subsp. vulgaris]
MAKGSKKGNGGQKSKQPVKVVKKSQSGDVKKKVNNAEAVRQQMDKWIESIHTPLRPTPGNVVNPSPHPMQQLVSNTGIKPPFRIINGFIRRVWGKFGIDRIAMGSNGVFVVRFRSMEGKQKAVDDGPILYDRKPVIVKNWSPKLDLMAEEVKYWGPSALNKITSLIGKPIRTDRAIAQKDILEFARILVEVHLDCCFPEERRFMNEKGVSVTQKVVYECRPTFCGDCGSIGHTVEECRKKKYELALKKVKPRQVWVEKNKIVGASKPAKTEAGAQPTIKQKENIEQAMMAGNQGDKQVDVQTRVDIQGQVSTEAGTSGHEAGARGTDVNLMQGEELLVPPNG